VYIDDVMRVKFATDCKLTVYANDMPLYMPIYMDKIEDYAILQESINMLNSWVLDSHLKLNPSKCKYMIISRRKNQVLHPHLYT